MKRFIFLLLLITTSVAKPPALPNCGGSCYMNALLQALYNIPPLTEFLIINKKYFEQNVLAKNYIGLITTITEGDIKTIEQPLKSFYDVVNTYMGSASLITEWYKIKEIIEWYGTRKGTEKEIVDAMLDEINKQIEEIEKELSEEKGTLESTVFLLDQKKLLENAKENLYAGVRPREVFNKTLHEFIKKRTPSKQQDAASFLAKLLAQLTDEYQVPIASVTSINQLLNPVLLSSITCPAPLVSSSIKSNSALVISVEVYKASAPLITLEECLNNFFMREKIKKYAVGEYYRSDCTNKLSLKTASPYLIIHLKRLASKMNHDIAIPLKLDFKKVVDAGINAEYNLISIIMREKEKDRHYTAYINDQFESPSPWYFCDDDKIIKTEQDLFFKQQLRENAYILFYQRADYQSKKTVLAGNVAHQLDQLSHDLAVLQKALAQ